LKNINENKVIEVCSACKCASCWYGEFICDDAQNASTELKTVKELRKLNTHENEQYWSDEYMKRIFGEANPFGLRESEEVND